jgi:DNA-binding transcriptional ArsR family regulator
MTTVCELPGWNATTAGGIVDRSPKTAVRCTVDVATSSLGRLRDARSRSNQLAVARVSSPGMGVDRARYQLAHLGDAIGDPSRAAMLVALMGGLELPASDLARAAGVARSTATEHLQNLERAGLVRVRRQGRHRYFVLAGPEVAEVLERLGSIDPRPRPPRRDDDPLARARTCYAHLAGRLAVELWGHARHRGWIAWTEEAVILSEEGRAAFASQQVVLETTPTLRGTPCLDWTERRPHVAGRLGVALCDAFFASGWVKRTAGTRALRITARGEEGIARLMR